MIIFVISLGMRYKLKTTSAIESRQMLIAKANRSPRSITSRTKAENQTWPIYMIYDVGWDMIWALRTLAISQASIWRLNIPSIGGR